MKIKTDYDANTIIESFPLNEILIEDFKKNINDYTKLDKFLKKYTDTLLEELYMLRDLFNIKDEYFLQDSLELIKKIRQIPTEMIVKKN